MGVAGGVEVLDMCGSVCQCALGGVWLEGGWWCVEIKVWEVVGGLLCGGVWRYMYVNRDRGMGRSV